MYEKRIKKWFPLSSSKGFTLIELLISITLISILMTVTTNLYITGLKVYRKEFRNNNLQDENRTIIDRVVKEAKKSIGVAQTQGVYTANTTDTVILKVPSIDANGDYIFKVNGDFVFDYVIFTKSDKNLVKIVEPDAQSFRASENKTLSSRVDSLAFTYSPDIQNATRFSINLILKEGVGKEEVKVNTTSEIAFRNR